MHPPRPVNAPPWILAQKSTSRARRVLELATCAAQEFASPSIEPEHLLLGLVDEREGLAAHLLQVFDVDGDAVRRLLPLPLGKNLQNTHEPIPSEATNQLLLYAHQELTPLKHTYVGTEHLLLSLTYLSSGLCHDILASFKLGPTVIRDEVYTILGHNLD